MSRTHFASAQDFPALRQIPAEGNPDQDGSEQHAPWAAGHEQIAGAARPTIPGTPDAAFSRSSSGRF
ncbi:hypothetical protein LJR220_003225 [Bradyrhizobium sp. LjRoot220]